MIAKTSTVKPVLLFGYGNPGRGDDALGPMLIDAIEAEGLPSVNCQTDMQLQVEHVTDLAGRSLVLFVDADMACAEPCELTELVAAKDDSYTSHAMSPVALLHAYRKVYGEDPPAAFVLRIRGHVFELGDTLSAAASGHLDAAIALVRKLCAQPEETYWRARLGRPV